MGWIQTGFRWFSGGDVQYHTLWHCMHGDAFWVSTTVALDLAVAVGYVLIASHWYKNERTLPPSPARTALATMRGIFTFCGICGYLFIPVKLVWPAWRLYDLFMVVLVVYTWRYALNVKGLRVLYSAVGRSDQLASDLAAAREESKRKGAFLNAISHDLRTPLNGLMLHANLAELMVADLATGGGDPVAVTESLAEIKSAARLTAGLLDGLLEYARLDGAEDRVVSADFPLDGLAADVVTAYAHEAVARGLDLSFAVPTSLVLRTDRLKLERVLNNLVGNAIKYTPAGSVRVVAEAAGSGVEVHVIDTGVGISPGHVGRLFDEFFQVKNDERDRHKGFGLGLSIARRLARQLGGDLAVASTPGCGSRFTVALPDVTLPTAAHPTSGAHRGSLGRPVVAPSVDRPAFVQPQGALGEPAGVAGRR